MRSVSYTHLQGSQQLVQLRERLLAEIAELQQVVAVELHQVAHRIHVGGLQAVAVSYTHLIYWLARMVEGGEDPAFIARRLVISASEDIGLANPNALLLANACFDTLMKIGWPEGRIPLAETTIYLATSPKSNSAYSAINDALELVRSTGNLPVPLHLRNAPTKLMKQLGYGQEYKYAHSYEGNFVKQQFLPDELKDKRIWQPQNNPAEQKHAERMIQLWGDKFKK